MVRRPAFPSHLEPNKSRHWPETGFEEIGSRGKFINALPPGLDLNSVTDLQPRSVRAQTAESVPSRLFANCAEGIGALLECLEGVPLPSEVLSCKPLYIFSCDSDLRPLCIDAVLSLISES